LVLFIVWSQPLKVYKVPVSSIANPEYSFPTLAIKVSDPFDKSIVYKSKSKKSKVPSAYIVEVVASKAISKINAPVVVPIAVNVPFEVFIVPKKLSNVLKSI